MYRDGYDCVPVTGVLGCVYGMVFHRLPYILTHIVLISGNVLAFLAFSAQPGQECQFFVA